MKWKLWMMRMRCAEGTIIFTMHVFYSHGIPEGGQIGVAVYEVYCGLYYRVYYGVYGGG